MAGFQEYPIVDKVVSHLDQNYKISVVTLSEMGAMAMSTWHVVSAANYSTGKELRIAIRNMSNRPTCGIYRNKYEGHTRYLLGVGIPATHGWPQLLASLDVRVIRARADGPPENFDKITQEMIADMVYLYMYPEDVSRLPMQIHFTIGGQVYNFSFSPKKSSFLHHPDVFTFNPDTPIIP